MTRCPTCGHPVESIFDHIAIDCEHDMTEEEATKLMKESDQQHAEENPNE